MERSATSVSVPATAGDTQDSGLLWQAVDRLVDRAPGFAELRLHGIQLLAARRLRGLGRSLPPELVEEERHAAVRTLAVPELIRRVRETIEGPLVMMKGPEVAARYPDPALRPFRDLDMLVSNAEEAQASLLDAGFEEVGDPSRYADIQHLRPLRWRTLPLLIEIHDRPKWPEGMSSPKTAELVALAEPSVTGVAGVGALPRAHHAVLIAAHAWAHAPLRRLRDLVDVAAMADGVDPTEIAAVARAWSLERLWRTTRSAADSVLFGAPAPRFVRLLGPHLFAVRERTVVENHLMLSLSPFGALPPARAARFAARAVATQLRPGTDEAWSEKGARAMRAFRNRHVTLGEHDQSAGAAERRRPGPPR
jgi:hypothetical protein